MHEHHTSYVLVSRKCIVYSRNIDRIQEDRSNWTMKSFNATQKYPGHGLATPRQDFEARAIHNSKFVRSCLTTCEISVLLAFVEFKA